MVADIKGTVKAAARRFLQGYNAIVLDVIERGGFRTYTEWGWQYPTEITLLAQTIPSEPDKTLVYEIETRCGDRVDIVDLVEIIDGKRDGCTESDSMGVGASGVLDETYPEESEDWYAEGGT